ncbi:glycoside hydrolase family 130 protein [Armatimonas sp.]|uniref:glycoside hydrolase family 130 protein n=1 Tax=Armatimonas sp. TaxID=1872638 RepID=UPI003750A48C
MQNQETVLLSVRHTGPILKPSSARVLLRAFNPTTEQRSIQIIARISAMPEEKITTELEQILRDFERRHHNFRAYCLRRFEHVKSLLLTDRPLSEERKLLIGAYFTQEYALEGAALFNPSLVWHPDQSELPEGASRFILSLRATGEGHISSIAFRTGIVDAKNQIKVEEPTRFVVSPEAISYPLYDRTLFERKLHEMDHRDMLVTSVLSTLAEKFTLEELKASVQLVERQNRGKSENVLLLNSMLTLARANYVASFSLKQPLFERVLFPTSPTEINGIEDARFVAFQEDDGKVIYYATYTAYDGKVTMPQLLQTEDFLTFEMSTLNGPEIHNKGMALFPRRIKGRYAMLSRQDNENIYLMYSDHLHFWYTKEILLKPTYPWEYVQLGNSGSPIETEAGWLVLTHGVGPMRQYAIGAILLDKDDPSCVIGRLHEPLLTPGASEREGYVPNVVYSCGAQIHNNELILPYAMSDYASSFAVIPMGDILGAMKLT